MTFTKYECLEDRLLIRPIKQTELAKTEGGIIDPNVKQKPVLKGTVVSVGLGYTARDTGVFVNTVLSKGDTVLYGASAGIEIEIEKEDGSGKESVWLMRESDVLLLIKKSEE
jgi:co-chaperonin GroES (HSP10)